MIDHWPTRAGMIAAHKRSAGSAANLIIGDSITEQFWWSEIGVSRMVNAGIGGIGVDGMLDFIGPILSGSRCKYAFLMLGTNDAFDDTVTATWAAKYQTIINAIVTARINPILVSIPPLETGKSLSDSRSQTKINQLNAQIVAKATAQRRYLVNCNTLFMAANGHAKPNTTVDGIHLMPVPYTQLYYAYAAALKTETLRNK